MARFGEYVICKNQIIRARDGGIPQNDLWPGRGRVVFTVMEARGTKLFHYDEHFARLEMCAGKIGIPVWSSKEILKVHLKALLNKCGFKESLVAVHFSAGNTEDNWHKAYPLSYTPVYASVYEHERKGGTIKLKAIEFCRPMAGIKHTDYLFGNVECEIAEEEGCGDVLYFDPYTKDILETSRKNILLVKPDGHIYTPNYDNGNILRGITLEILMDMVLQKELCVSINRDSHLKLQEFFDLKIEGAIVASTGGVFPVESINGIGLPIKNRIWDICGAFEKYREEYFAKEK